MKTSLVLIFILAAAGANCFPAKAAGVEDDLSSTEGLMRLIPQLKNARGQFEIPNPRTDLKDFLIVHQSLTESLKPP